MLEQLQLTIAPYLKLFGDHVYIQALMAIAFSFIAAWLFNRVIMTTLKRMVAKTKIKFDDYLIALLHSPIYYSLLLMGFSSAALILAPPAVYLSIFFSLAKTFLFIIWTNFLLKVNRIFLTHLSRNPRRVKVIHQQTLPLFLNLINITIIVMTVYFIFSAWHVDMTAWLASAGIVGIAVGFAAKDTLANLFSGVFIMADTPYKIGDFIVLDSGERGEVTHIGIRSTRILTRDDVEVTVPNSVMGNTKIINESGGPHEKYRCRIPVGVAYGTDIDLVREVLMSVAQTSDNVCNVPEPRVRFRTFGASSLDFELLIWINQPVLKGRVIDHINCAVYKKFIEHKIEIPYSKQDIYIKELPSNTA